MKPILKFDNSGVVFDRLPSEAFEQLKKHINIIENDFSKAVAFNNQLAGNIVKEYLLNDAIKYVESTVLNLAAKHDNTFSYLKKHKVMNGYHPLMIDTLWVNFQKKYEFNPPHNHSGIYSFVIWIKIPYDPKKEKELFPTKQSNPASFNFLTYDSFGDMLNETIPVDNTYEGIVCLFPSKLIHYVNPFYTSDDYRISVAGNITFR